MSTRKEHIESIMNSMHAIKRTFMKCGPKNSEITHSQWAVLSVVMEKGSTNVKEIAQQLDITSSAATQLIDGLVSKKILIRESDVADRRSAVLTLSGEFKKKMDGAKAEMLEKIRDMFDCLTDKELADYAALNKKLTNRS